MRPVTRRWLAAAWLTAMGILPAFLGCGSEDTGLGPIPEDGLGRPVDYFIPAVGDSARFIVYSEIGESLGIACFSIVNTFAAAEFSGFVAVDSFAASVDTFWITVSADTVFELSVGAHYSRRQPIVRNHTKSDFVWPLYAVNAVGSPDRYTVYWRQRPVAETVVLTRNVAYTACGRTDLFAVMEQSGDTIRLGSEYFSPTESRAWVLRYFRPFTDWPTYYRELLE